MSIIAVHNQFPTDNAAKLNLRFRQSAAAQYHSAALLEIAPDKEPTEVFDLSSGSRAQYQPAVPKVKKTSLNPKVAKSENRFESLWNHWEMDDSLYAGEQVFAPSRKSSPDTLTVLDEPPDPTPQKKPEYQLPPLYWAEMNQTNNTLFALDY